MNTLNLKYKALHGFYWMLFCLPTGYITIFLLSHDVSSSLIGVITAVSSILAAVGQLVVGNIADSFKKISWKGLLLIICALQAAILVTLLIFQRSSLASTVLFPAFLVLMYLQMPLINASVFYYTSRNMNLDFGSARGMGSLTYAFISFVCGQLIVITGEVVILYLSLLTLLGLITITAIMPTFADDNTQVSTNKSLCEASTKTRKSSIIYFAKKYPEFTLVLIGSILIMSFHNISHTYMIQIMGTVNGNSADMGTAFAIEAISELPIMFGFYKLIQRFSADKLMITASIVFVFKALAYLCAANVISLYLAQLLQMFSYAIFASASVYFANSKMDEEDKVTGQSYMTATMSIGAVFGNFIGGYLLDRYSVTTMLVASIILTATGALVTFAGARTKK